MSTTSRSIPTPALLLGLGGLIPFICSALFVWNPAPLDAYIPQWLLANNSVPELATKALGAYGAVILSFLGGVRWGNLLFDNTRLNSWLPLTLSVMPSIVAWFALLLTAPGLLTVLAIAFLFQLALDNAAESRQEIPAWFLRLRIILTTGAVISLLTGLLGVVLT